MQAPWLSRFVRPFLYGLPLLGIVAWFGLKSLAPMSEPAACAALAQSRVVHVFAAEGVELRCAGVALVDTSALAGPLAGSDGEALAVALRRVKGSAIAVLPRGPSDAKRSERSLVSQLAALQHVTSLRAVLLSSELAVYVPAREVELSFREREALAHVARVLFRGAREPSLSSFPAALRRVERVEVMVMLSERGEPRLWRSARGTSIARALLTATRVARERWREREQAMGGPLAKHLIELDVEVSLLSEDGLLLRPQRMFVDRAITPLHGLGFDYRTAWHYLLPRDVQKRKGGPFDALSAQITEQGLPLSILSESDTRVYRFVPLTLGVSRAPLAQDPGL
ncbi:MAG: hypothetical protein JWN04_6721 [Myxococcaceae bacterium]|nr:hypothetical protein [Myxococcaceae bacterium]